MVPTLFASQGTINNNTIKSSNNERQYVAQYCMSSLVHYKGYKMANISGSIFEILALSYGQGQAAHEPMNRMVGPFII